MHPLCLHILESNLGGHFGTRKAKSEIKNNITKAVTLFVIMLRKQCGNWVINIVSGNTIVNMYGRFTAK